MRKRKKNSPPTGEKDQKIYSNLSKVLQQFMAGRRYEPMGQLALLKRLKIPSSLHPLCKQILADLLEEGIVEKQKNQLSLKKPKEDPITGVLRMHPRGFGFVVVDDPSQSSQDVFIPKHLTDHAVDGDRVEITINPDSNWEKGPDGRVVSVLSRARTHLGGTVRQRDPSGNALVHVPLLGPSKPALVRRENSASLKAGDRVILKVIEWGDQNDSTLCEVSHLIGNISDPTCDIQAAIEEYDLRSSFPTPVLEEARALGTKVGLKDKKGRKNLTALECFTIDPDTAKDFDDALSLTKDRKGNFQLGVHIADAAYYVKAGSALDKEASERCNSTYFPGTCLPMLPEELSTHLCSLRANVIRLSVSVLMEFDKEGNLFKYDIVRSYIKSKKRFTYLEAKAVIDKKKKSIHATSLKNMVDLCLLLKKKRFERGSIDFSLPDMVIEVDSKGEPSQVKWVEYDISHQLVEEFMLKANEVVAKHLSESNQSLLYRIHEHPAEDNFQEFLSMARLLGFSLPDKPTTKDIQHLFELAKKTPYGQQLSLSFIRSMKLAYYSPNNVGHFGLALEYYCHFTSPIRRYTDLIIQRILFKEYKKEPELDKIALKCSDQERVSFRAESSVKILKKLRLLSQFMREDPEREYSAVVTRIKPFGLFFEATDLMLEGFLHISELEEDFFVFDQTRNILQGRRTGKRHTLGELIKVKALSIDLILLECKWALVGERKRSSSHKEDSFKKKGRKRRR